MLLGNMESACHLCASKLNMISTNRSYSKTNKSLQFQEPFSCSSCGDFGLLDQIILDCQQQLRLIHLQYLFYCFLFVVDGSVVDSDWTAGNDPKNDPSVFSTQHSQDVIV